MKYLIAFFCLLLVSNATIAQARSKAAKTPPPPSIHWMDLDEVEAQLKIQPKKIYILLYSENDGWCKMMDSKTFSNKHVIEYLNTNFYALRLNAESTDTLVFKGKKYGPVNESKLNALAAKFMNNKIRYPFNIIFDEKFEHPIPVPGYLDVPNLELMLKYVIEAQHKKIAFDKFKDEFEGSW